MNIYRGFLKGDGKKTIEKFKGDNSNLVSYETARKYKSFVGVLDEDYVMLDIDSKDEADLLLNIIKNENIDCAVLKTSKGIHVYFKGYELRTNKIEWYCPIGVKVTVKLGSKNTVDPLKIDGEVRKWIKKGKNHAPLPKWLYPLNQKNNYVTKISEGSRNQELFNYILKLQSLSMSKEEIKQTIKIINKYVLKDSLPDSEIDTILRDDAFLKESFFKEKTFLHDAFAKFLITEHHIILIKNVLHIYKDGVYSDNQQDIERAMIRHLPMLTKARRQEVMSYLQISAVETRLSPINYIALNNGLFNLDTWSLSDFTPNIILKNKIPVSFIENSYHETTDKTLNKIACHDKELRVILEEIFGYILLRRNEMRKCFILVGGGKNGKSTYLNMIRQFCGEENVSSLDLKEIGQRFKTAELFGKLVNIGDDISKEYIKNNSEFKKVVTGEAINVERKGRDPFDFENYSKLIFSANDMPRINDSSEGLISRLMMIPFNASFSPSDKDYDPFISDKLKSKEAMEYLLILAIQSLKRLLKNKQFAVSKRVEEETKAYEETNNPIITFVKNDFKILNETTSTVYQIYQVWCAENGFKPLGNQLFSKEVCRLLKIQTKQLRVEGKRKYFFVEK